MRTEDLTAQIDVLLAEVERARQASPYDDLSGGLGDDGLMGVYTRLRAGIDRLSPPGSRYAKEAEAIAERSGLVGEAVLGFGGVLQAMKADFEAGYTQSFKELVHSAVFEDFLDMATELLSKGYENPAAVVAGSVLEEHVRSLAVVAGVSDAGPRRMSVDTMLIELVKHSHISESQRKLAAAWYGLRNEAAHGHFENVAPEDVRRMIDGVRDFMLRYPA
jgi:hypothetical protein